MQYIIMTSDRPVNYLAETLSSFERHVGEPAYISHGSPGTSNLSAALLSPESPHSIHFLPDMDKEPFLSGEFGDARVRGNNYRLITKATLNFINCLLIGEDPLEDCCIFEDDVQFSSKSRSVLTQLKGYPHIVALYHAYDFTTDPHNFLSPYPVGDFYGLQGTYFPSRLRKPFAEFLVKHVATAPHDLLLKTFVTQHSEPLFALKKCIVQHTGVVTTGLGHHHQTNHFIP